MAIIDKSTAIRLEIRRATAERQLADAILEHVRGGGPLPTNAKISAALCEVVTARGEERWTVRTLFVDPARRDHADACRHGVFEAGRLDCRFDSRSDAEAYARYKNRQVAKEQEKANPFKTAAKKMADALYGKGLNRYEWDHYWLWSEARPNSDDLAHERHAMRRLMEQVQNLGGKPSR